MKFRMISVVLILSLAAWLPSAMAQQGAPAQPAAPSDSKSTAGSCCDHNHHQGDAAKSCCHDKGSASCCKGKNGEDMACCQERTKGDQSAMNCCKGKDGKMCAKNSKGCCAGKDGKSCCGKDTAACNSSNDGPCCDEATGRCGGCARS